MAQKKNRILWIWGNQRSDQMSGWSRRPLFRWPYQQCIFAKKKTYIIKVEDFVYLINLDVGRYCSCGVFSLTSYPNVDVIQTEKIHWLLLALPLRSHNVKPLNFPSGSSDHHASYSLWAVLSLLIWTIFIISYVTDWTADINEMLGDTCQSKTKLSTKKARFCWGLKLKI